MKTKSCLKGMYLLSAASLVLPWFTYNPGVMGYCRGIAFLKWFALPLILTGIHLFCLPRSRTSALLAEAAVLAGPGICVMALGKWQEVCNIAGGFHWEDGIRTAQPGYWIAAGLFLVQFVLYQVYFAGIWGNDPVQEGRTNSCE